ncbi:hypothetical protein E2C01_066943 [Portunus trituberculatus]|uniref:Uncharacterized protein n=1 Tax=Portunus trituberculatus TaxID=210409 RepID=A0A5B7HII6_PORTR|nr:hypothetical protein [Portunus trituberculatus]
MLMTSVAIHSTSPRDLQFFLDSFSVASSQCGIIISLDKSRIISCCPHLALPDFTIGRFVSPLCSQYRYLGAPVKLSPVLPAIWQVNSIISDLLARLQRRFKPLQWLTNFAFFFYGKAYSACRHT